MSNTKWLISSVLVLVGLTCPGWIDAQEPFEPGGPFIEPMHFDPDFQLFKPFDTFEYGSPRKPRIGWFAAYDRLYITVSRPETGGTNGLAGQRIFELMGGEADEDALRPQPRPVNTSNGLVTGLADRGDFTYGNRLDVGFMTEANTGWSISWININNPNVEHIVDNVSNGGEPIQQDLDADQDQQAMGGGSYNDLLGDPFGDFKSSINSGRFWSFELNKLFRLEPFHNNVVLEPLVGVRYINFKDFFFAKDAEFDLVFLLDADSMPVPATVLEIDEFHGAAINEILTGQLGFRTYGHRGRWLLSGELRLFAGNNFQHFERIHRDELQMAGADTGDGGGGGGGGDAAVGEQPDAPDTGVEVRREEFEMTEFAVGTDIRANASYFISRDVALNLGLEIIHIGKGVARGFDLNNDERLTLIGATFGILVNR